MKRLILLSSIVTMVFCLQACGQKQEVPQNSGKEYELIKEQIFGHEKENGAGYSAPSLEDIPVEKVSQEELLINLQEEEGSFIKEYESFLDFQYEFLEYADEDVISLLKETYAMFDFSCEFKSGDKAIYKQYIEKYHDFLKNKIPYYSIETNEQTFCKNAFPQIEENVEEDAFYLFDADEDGVWEMGVASPHVPMCEYIFKYDEERNVVFLWKDVQGYTLRGSRTISWEWDGIRFAFYRLDENGEEISSIFFYIKADQEEPVFMVGTPRYNDEKMTLENDISEQAFYDISNKCYLFKVTEEEWDEITKPFFEMAEITNNYINDITYSYGELFGGL